MSGHVLPCGVTFLSGFTRESGVLCVCVIPHMMVMSSIDVLGGGGEEEFIQLVIFKFANIGSSTAV